MACANPAMLTFVASVMSKCKRPGTGDAGSGEEPHEGPERTLQSHHRQVRLGCDVPLIGSGKNWSTAPPSTQGQGGKAGAVPGHGPAGATWPNTNKSGCGCWFLSLPQLWLENANHWRTIARLHAGVPVTKACWGFHGPAMEIPTPPKRSYSAWRRCAFETVERP
jgi:hypothetical protein